MIWVANVHIKAIFIFYKCCGYKYATKHCQATWHQKVRECDWDGWFQEVCWELSLLFTDDGLLLLWLWWFCCCNEYSCKEKAANQLSYCRHQSDLRKLSTRKKYRRPPKVTSLQMLQEALDGHFVPSQFAAHLLKSPIPIEVILCGFALACNYDVILG